MNYAELKKLDEKTLQKLTEGLGPSDECLCSLLAPPEDQKKGIRHSIKRAFASLAQVRERQAKGKGQPKELKAVDGSRTKEDKRGNVIDIPLSFTKSGQGVYTTKEVVKRDSPCGKCGCDNENIVLKHSYANIRITSPDVSSICPCSSDCLPDRDKFQNNIKVTIERMSMSEDLLKGGEDQESNRTDLQQESLSTITQEQLSIDESETRD